MKWVKIPRKNMELSFRKKRKKKIKQEAEWQKCVGGGNSIPAETTHIQGRLL